MSSNVPNINLGATNPLDPNPNSDFNLDRVSRVSQSREQMMTGGLVEMDAMPFSPMQPAQAEAACFEMYPVPSQVHHQGPPTAAIPSAPVYSSEPSLCKHFSASEPSLLSAGRRSNAGFCAKPNRAGLSRHTSGTNTSGGSVNDFSQSQSSLDRLSPIYEVVSNLNLFGQVEDRDQYYAESESETGCLAESMTESDEQGGAHRRNSRKSARDGRTREHQGSTREREGARGNQHRKHKKKTRHIEQHHSHSGKKGKKTNRVAARRLYVELKASSDESSSSDSDSDLGQVVTHSHQHYEKAAVQNQSVNWGSKGVKKPPPYQETEDKFSDPEEPSTSTQRKKKKKKSKCCGKTSTKKKTAGFLAGLVVGIGATTAFIRSGGAGATAVAGFFGFAGAVNSGSTVEGNNNTVVGSGSNGLVNWNEMYVPPDPALLESLIKRNQMKCLQAGMVLKDPSDNSWWGWNLRVDGPVCLMNIPQEMYQGACRLVGQFLDERNKSDSSAAPPLDVPNLQSQIGDPQTTASAQGISTGASSTSGISFSPQQRDPSQASTSGVISPRFATSSEGTSVTNANNQVTTQSLLDAIRGSTANQADTTQGTTWLNKASKEKKASKGKKADKKRKN